MNDPYFRLELLRLASSPAFEGHHDKVALAKQFEDFCLRGVEPAGEPKAGGQENTGPGVDASAGVGQSCGDPNCEACGTRDHLPPEVRELVRMFELAGFRVVLS